jgi:hypothetical protein
MSSLKLASGITLEREDIAKMDRDAIGCHQAVDRR